MMLSTIVAISFDTIPSFQPRGLMYLKEGSPGTFILRGHASTLILGRGRHIERRRSKKGMKYMIGGSGRKRRMVKLEISKALGQGGEVGHWCRRGHPTDGGRRGTIHG